MDSFTMNDRAKLVIIEEIVQGEIAQCDIIMYEPKCFARLRPSVTVAGFQSDTESYINMKHRSLNVT